MRAGLLIQWWTDSLLKYCENNSLRRRGLDIRPIPSAITPVANTDRRPTRRGNSRVFKRALPPPCEPLRLRARPVPGSERGSVSVRANLAEFGSVGFFVGFPMA